MPKTITMPYHVPSAFTPVVDSKGCRHYQHNMIVLVKVQLAKQRKTAKMTAKTKLLKIHNEGLRSQGTTPSPSMHCGKKHDWGVGAIMRQAT